MSMWRKGVAAVVLGAVGAGALALLLAEQAWDRKTAREVARLELLRQPGALAYSPDRLADLPEPVVRYFEYALKPGQRMIRRARIDHEGEFRASIDGPWSPFVSRQHFSVSPPGYVWDARIQMAPFVIVAVRDVYAHGRGQILGRLARVFTVVNECGSVHINSGSLHRLLAESVWLPTALLPSDDVSWEPIDEVTARVTLADAGMSESMTVHFGASGEIQRIEAQRFMDEGGDGVRHTWRGHFREYREIEGIMLPVTGEVEWVLPEGVHTYWRGRITAATFDYVE